jgi:putative transposase
MDDNYRTPLIEAAIWMAARNHDIEPAAIFHSDRLSSVTILRCSSPKRYAN